ncbi:response regulator transcription factor [Streptomyces sp. NPDC002039]|uniref:response regulator transcription factor n=1 Tax=unclassified Streptomyces TaxID=2593676 RepID=UPI00332AC126
MTVTVVIADDQEMVRTGFRLILESHEGISVVGEASNGVEAVEAVRRLVPDVCLMDVRMPGLDGLEATRLLRTGPHAAASRTRIVIVTTFDLDEYAYQALRAGANGFIVKNAGSRLLVEAVHAAAQGESLISPSTTVRLLSHFNRLPAQRNTTQLQRLTPQELKVATLVARGRTNNEIATELSLAVSTIKSHLSRIQERLPARNRVEIAAWAWEHGLVS